MKLTKSQTKELLNCHPGVGNLVVNLGDHLEIINIYLSAKGDFNTGTMCLRAYLANVSARVLEYVKEKPMKLLYSLADWIDTYTIAECVVEEMKEQGLELTLENAREVWLHFLTSLPTHLVASVDRIGDRTNAK